MITSDSSSSPSASSDGLSSAFSLRRIPYSCPSNSMISSIWQLYDVPSSPSNVMIASSVPGFVGVSLVIDLLVLHSSSQLSQLVQLLLSSQRDKLIAETKLMVRRWISNQLTILIYGQDHGPGCLLYIGVL